ncbi:MAG: hypothetical protein LBT40_10565, partial [Deltaproteobacteria bacterium]|nr:hypothetical protein [Deltaproteobacteria bacterium]
MTEILKEPPDSGKKRANPGADPTGNDAGTRRAASGGALPAADGPAGGRSEPQDRSGTDSGGAKDGPGSSSEGPAHSGASLQGGAGSAVPGQATVMVVRRAGGARAGRGPSGDPEGGGPAGRGIPSVSDADDVPGSAGAAGVETDVPASKAVLPGARMAGTPGAGSTGAPGAGVADSPGDGPVGRDGSTVPGMAVAVEGSPASGLGEGLPMAWTSPEGEVADPAASGGGVQVPPETSAPRRTVEIPPPSRQRAVRESFVPEISGAKGVQGVPGDKEGSGGTARGSSGGANSASRSGASGPREGDMHEGDPQKGTQDSGGQEEGMTEEPARDDGQGGRPKKGKYQHKVAKRPPKRVRRVITRANPEVLQKLEELKETERRLFPDAAAGRERREAAEEAERLREEARSASKKPAPLSRKAKRDLRKYGVTSQGAGKPYSSRKLLNFRMLFAETPIEEAGDCEVAANMRLLFLAHADHNMPDTLEKFVAYLRNSLCSGISGEQLERVMDILVRHGYVTVSKGKIA